MGHTGSNSVESFNARAIAYRKIPLSLALMPAARLMAEMHNTANMNAHEHQGALPPRVEEDAVTMRDQAANIPASHVKHVGTNMYQVHSPRNNDVFDVDLHALKCGDRVGACDCGTLLHNRAPFCQHIAAACKKEATAFKIVCPSTRPL